LWRPVNDRKVFHASYADLRQKFRASVGEMLAFAGLTGEDHMALEQQVALDRLRQKQNDAEGVLFRRGAVGESADAIPANILSDIARIQAMGGLRLKMAAFAANPKVVAKPHFKYPGKTLLMWSLRAMRGSRQRGDKQRTGEAFWWR
jgi:hypothetical protein